MNKIIEKAYKELSCPHCVEENGITFYLSLFIFLVVLFIPIQLVKIIILSN